ncbi:MAG: CPBP family intramembrane glutamic endopeptidase [Halobacteriota archaeon]
MRPRGERPPRRLLYETIVVFLVTFLPLALVPLVPALAGIAALLALLFPIVYLFVEKWARHRPWKQLGVKRHGFVADLAANWQLYLLVVVVLQIVPVMLFFEIPGGVGHILGRIPEVNTLAVLIPLIIILALREELVFRALFQQRFGWYVGTAPALVFMSIIFALSHFTAGALLVVAVDLLFVFFDGVVYGLIFARSQNVFVAWFAHLSADIVGLALLLAASLAIA